MSDDINDDLLNNLPTPKLENLNNEIILTNEMDTVIPKQETETMEVHHHPDLHHKPKPWKEYFLEFLMIFIAVTLGFIAENMRETISDRTKEKEYLISIKKDLIDDTASLGIWIPQLIEKISGYDTLISLLQNPGFTSQGSELYYYARFSTRSSVFNANNNTITELKNSGNFRLIHNKAVINALMNFQTITDNYLNLSAVDHKEAEMLYPSLGNLFDASVFNEMIKVDINPNNSSVDSVISSIVMEKNLSKPPGNPQLRNHNNDNINLYIFYLHERKSSFIGEIRLLFQQKKNASDLIELINKEYHIANK